MWLKSVKVPPVQTEQGVTDRMGMNDKPTEPREKLCRAATIGTAKKSK